MFGRAIESSLILVVLLLTGCGSGGGDSGSTPLSVDSAYVAYLNQLVDSGDDPLADSVTTDLYADLLELFADRAYDTGPDDINDKIVGAPLDSSSEDVTFVAFAAGDTNTTLANGHAKLNNRELYLTVAMGDITANPLELRAPAIRTYTIVPDDRILANDKVWFRVIHALAGSPILKNVTVLGGHQFDELVIGEATDYFLEEPAPGDLLTVSLDGTLISCLVEPGGDYEAIIAHTDFDTADPDSQEPALFCHRYRNPSTIIISR